MLCCTGESGDEGEDKDTAQQKTAEARADAGADKE